MTENCANSLESSETSRGLVLSGGGSRAAYQAGALKALEESFPEGRFPFSVIVGSSIGAVNGVLFSAALRRSYKDAVETVVELWRERTFENTFGGPLTLTLLRSIRVGFLQYLSPGPKPTTLSIFDPAPLRRRMDETLFEFGGAQVQDHHPDLSAIGVMTTREGDERKGLLLVNARREISPKMLKGISFGIHYVNHLSSSHAFASAALPSVLPPVEIRAESGDVRLVDGGISDNIPVDPAVRFGATDITIIDTSGKKWWCDRYNKPHYSRDPWELPVPPGTYCLQPKSFREFIPSCGLGKVLKESLGSSTKDYIRAFGPTWPIYRLLRNQMGEELALETMSYAVIHPPYLEALVELGYGDTKRALWATEGLSSSE